MIEQPKPLRFQILQFLLDNDAIDKKIDIPAHFLINNDSEESRKELRIALDYLKEERFINLTGDPIQLLWRHSGLYTSIYHSGVKASITKLGEQEIAPKVANPGAVHINVGHAHNSVIGSQLDQSFLELNNRSNDAPANTPTVAHTHINKTTVEKTGDVLLWIIKNVWKYIIGVTIGFTVAYLAQKYGLLH